MSGSGSSARDADTAEPLRLTVHAVEHPELAADGRRTRRGRLAMLLLLLVCAAPVIASYLMYFVVRPGARANYGTLIEPPRPLPAMALQALDGAPRSPASLHGQWLLLVVGPSGCDAACERRLYTQRQLREMLGRDRDRLDKVWLVVDDGPVAAPLRAALEASPAVTVLRAPPQSVAAWLQPAPGRPLDEHLYLVDPMGDWMMRFPADADPARVKRDLDRLLRASSSWDRPGR